MKYAPPEQKGDLPGVSVCKQSDLYTFGKTCCEALFGRADPKPWDYDELLPAGYEALRTLLDRCTAHPLKRRPADFEEVATILEALGPQQHASGDRMQEEAEAQSRRGGRKAAATGRGT